MQELEVVGEGKRHAEVAWMGVEGLGFLVHRTGSKLGFLLSEQEGLFFALSRTGEGLGYAARRAREGLG